MKQLLSLALVFLLLVSIGFPAAEANMTGPETDGKMRLEIVFDTDEKPFTYDSSAKQIFSALSGKTGAYFPCTLKQNGKVFEDIDRLFPEGKNMLILDGSCMELYTTGTVRVRENDGVFAYLTRYGLDGKESLFVIIDGYYFDGDGNVSFSIAEEASEYQEVSFYTEAVSPAIIVDNTPPVIKIKGESPLYVPLGGSFTDPGAEITDNLDPDIESRLITEVEKGFDPMVPTPSVLEFVPYGIFYTAKDHAGNWAEPSPDNPPLWDTEADCWRALIVYDKPLSAVVKKPKAITNLVYTGEPQAVIEPGIAENGVMKYAIGGWSSPFDSSVPTVTNAGQYAVWYIVKGDESHYDLYPERIWVTVEKALKPENVPEDMSVYADHKELSSLSLPKNWSWKQPNQALEIGANQTIVVYTGKDASNYEQTEFPITVYRSDSLEPPTLLSLPSPREHLVYNRSSQKLIEEGKAGDGSVLQYSLSQNGPYLTFVPTAENAGEYQVWYRAKNTQNGKVSTPGSLTVTIAKKESVDPYQLPQIKPVKYKIKLNSLKLPEDWSWSDPDQELAVGVNQVAIKYKDTENYEKTEYLIPITVEEPDVPDMITAPTAKSSLIYTGRAQLLTEVGVVNGGTLMYSLSETGSYAANLPTAENAGEYQVWYKVVGDAGYRDIAPASFSVTVAKAQRPGNIPEHLNYPAGATLSALPLPPGWSWKEPSRTLTYGDNRVTVVYGDTQNYEETEFEITVTAAVPGHKHTLVKTEGKAATCTEEGNLEYWTCMGCGCIFTDESGTAVTIPEERTLPLLAHVPGKEATCTAPQICTVCNNEIKAALGHDWDSWTQSKVPTCTEKGEGQHTCLRCGITEARELPAKGHTPGEWQVRTSPTITTEGERVRQCTVCNVIVEREKIPKLDPAPTPTDPPAPTELPFTDVKEGAWYYEAVSWAYENGLMSGTTETSFSPKGTTTRGMIVTILWRLEEKPQSTAPIAFADVKAGSYCYEAVRWAAEKGIVNGKSATRFAPNDLITRQELAAILYRYAGTPPTDGELNAFRDKEKVSGFAQPALCWAVENGIVSGKGNQTLDPKGKSNRAEAAAMLMRYCVS